MSTVGRRMALSWMSPQDMCRTWNMDITRLEHIDEQATENTKSLVLDYRKDGRVF